MQKYANSVQDTIGKIITAATVSVWTDAAHSVAATIYSDNGVTVLPSNTVKTDTLGEFYFYAADGRYYLSIAKAGITTQYLDDILLFDPAPSTGAAGVGCIGSGTGAVAEDLQSLLRRIQLQPQQYMTAAQKTDVANRALTLDVSAALQAAHDSLPTTGGTIVLPPGNYGHAAEVNFTKPVVIQGSGRGATTITMTSNALNRDCMQTSNSIWVRDLTIKCSTAPTTDLSMCGVRADITSNTGVTVSVENCEILDLCFPVFADGRGASQNALNIDIGVIRNCSLRVSSLAGAAADNFLSGCVNAYVEGNIADNQDLGDHNFYLIRNFNNYVRGNRCKNTTGASHCAIKMVTELSGDSGTLGEWIADGNNMESNALPIFVSITGSIVLPLLAIRNSVVKTARSTSAGNGGAFNISASNTSTYRQVIIDGFDMADLQLGAVQFTAGAGATFSYIYAGHGKVFDFSKSSANTYSAFVTDSSGTYAIVLIGPMNIDGNSTGRNGFNFASAAYSNFVDGAEVVESNCFTTSNPVPNFKIGRSSTGIQKLTWNATASVTDGATITHSLGTTPTAVIAVGTVSSQFVSVTAKGSTTFTVAIKKDDGTAGSSQTIYWMALV